MTIAERLRTLSERIDSLRDTIQTEEATKTALVLPFLQSLGYDVFNPLEVIPEFTADVGIKRGEKVDYAILRESKPIMLFECKTLGSDLTRYSSQLYRYFHTTEARLAILTDGVRYKLFADLREPNKMDTEPFMEFDLSDLTDRVVSELEKLSKQDFDLQVVLAAAATLRTGQELRQRLAAELTSPSDTFVRLIAEPIHEGRWTQSVADRFKGLVRSSVNQYLRDQVDGRLKKALERNDDRGESPAQPEPDEHDDKGGVETTVEELSGFFAVKAIIQGEVELRRVVARDTKSYFGVLLDDNNRKPICRLRFNRSKKYLGVFDSEKKETVLEVDGPDDLFKHADLIRESLKHSLAR